MGPVPRSTWLCGPVSKISPSNTTGLLSRKATWSARVLA